MTARLLGAILLAAGGLGMGLSAAREISRRLETLESWIHALALMEGELSFSLPDLPRLLEDLSRRCPGPAGRALATVLAGLDGLGERSFSQIWNQSLGGTAGSLGEEDLELLYRLGGLLGYGGGEERRRAAERTRRLLEKRATELRGSRERKGRTYGVLGLSLGCLLAILLL